MWSGTLETFGIIGVIIYLIGYSGLAGLGVVLLILPVQFLLGYLITYARKKVCAQTFSIQP